MPKIITQTPEERFWDKVDYLSNTECWLWNGIVNPNGYGYFRPGGRETKGTGAHRFSYELHHGPIPAGAYVLHSCDTPRCVNPAHLRAGTPKQNTDDMVSKGRQRPVGVRGEASYKAILTEADILAIRASPLGTSALGRQYGVSHQTIRAVRLRLSWAHVP